MILDDTKKPRSHQLTKQSTETTVKTQTIQSLLTNGLQANMKFRKSMDSLTKQGVTPETVSQVFQSQAELNRVNTAWNSFASMSLMLGQQRITVLETTIDEQGREIAGLKHNLTVHHRAIEKIFSALCKLSYRYQRLRAGHQTSAFLLRTIQSEVMLLKAKQLLAPSMTSLLTSAIGSALVSTMRYGLLALICDSIVKLSQLMSLVELLTAVFLGSNRRAAQRVHLATRVAAVLSLVLLLRKKFSVIMAAIKALLFH